MPSLRRSLCVFLTVPLAILAIACVHADSGAATYRTESGIAYRSTDSGVEDPGNRCVLDVYFPENVPNFPTLVWIHGGGLTEGQRFIPEKLKGQGIGIVAIGYRLSPGVKSPAYVEDAAAAVAWTFRNVASYGGSPDRIFLSGHSAGGYLALMLGLDRHYLEAQGIDANRLAGLIPLSGQAITHFTVRKERGISDKQPVVDEMAPLYHVRADAPPILLVTGDRELELLGRYEENAYLWRMLKIAGHKDVALEELKGLNHGGMLEPSLDRIIPFIRAHTPAP